MQINESKIWFPAKKYGWGWGFPCAWQGWVVYAVWALLLFGGGIPLALHHIGIFVVYSIVLSAVLMLIVVAKGEKPRWHWGDSENK